MNSEAVDERWGEELLMEAASWVEKAYPREGCGLIVENDQQEWRFLACENVIDRYHAVDPVIYPRTSEDFYMIDPREFMRVEDRGEKIAVIVHSHPDVGDYFSEEDRAAALMPRASEEEAPVPIYPGVDYLVISVREQEADAATLFRFDEVRGDFFDAGRFDFEEIRESIIDRSVQVNPVA